MDGLTVAILLTVAFFSLRGAFRGLSGELAPLIGLIAGAGALWFGYPPLNIALAKALPTLDSQACIFYAAIVAAIAGLVLFFILATLVQKVGAWIVPQPFNALLGALIGAAKIILFVSVIGGICAVATDRLKGLRKSTKESPLTLAIADFWSTRFKSVGELTSQHSFIVYPPETKKVPHGRHQ
ncbi:MAG: CvpA family protein [Kiritimatiellia bacterium]